ncbi:MAG: heavy-metal-associated domain-containing protein [Thiohalomonadales bacterium]
MKKFRIVLTSLAILIWSSASFAGGTQYNLRVDGLACPFCAYGIEKKFTKTEGVEKIDIDLQKGLVIVNTNEGKTFKEDELKTIIDDAGFTLKSMTEKPL